MTQNGIISDIAYPINVHSDVANMLTYHVIITVMTK